MISAFANSLKIPDLRNRILFTLALVIVVRIGTTITLPGVDTSVLQEWVKELTEQSGGTRGAAAITSLLNVFSGGALQNCAVFALGIMPYISASIMMQLLTAVVPKLSKISREEGGRQKITQYTRILTICLATFQGFLLVKSLQNPETNPFLSGLAGRGAELVPHYGWQFLVVGVFTIVAGTMFLMWLGDQITERGIGNGISLIISVNIIAGLPGAMVQVWRTYISAENAQAFQPIILLMLLVFFILVIAAVVSITQAQRQITVQYAKRVMGNRVYGGQSQYLPLKVNYSGVMPIIFASAIMLLPATLVGFLFPDSGIATFMQNLSDPGHKSFYVFTGILIFFFSYFWVANMFQPSQLADDLKRGGGYIPGIRPGKPTAEFLDHTMSRLTFAGAAFLTIVAILPRFISSRLHVPYLAAEFFGGTSLLILVGVLLDMMRQIETHLLQQNYDGFLRKGKIKGRYERRAHAGTVAGISPAKLVALWSVIAIILLIAIISYLLSSY